MKELITWAAVVCVIAGAVFGGAFGRFDHFWQSWEFLAAATATLHNLFFAAGVHLLREEKGEGTLSEALADRGAVFAHFILRLSLPTVFFFGTMMVILTDKHTGGSPVPADRVLWKLCLTLCASLRSALAISLPNDSSGVLLIRATARRCCGLPIFGRDPC